MKKKFVFWVVWLTLLPIVFLFFAFCDILKGLDEPTSILKTKMVFQEVYQNFILRKS